MPTPTTYHPDFYVTSSSKPRGGGFANIVRRGESGTRQVGIKRAAQLRSWNIELDWLGYTNANTWRAFFEARKGSQETFYWFTWNRTTRTGISVGTGDGSTTTFNLPFKSGTGTGAVVIKVNAVTKTDGVHYNLTRNGGTGGEDKIVFTGGNIPAPAEPITADFTTARERHIVAFADDDYDEQNRQGNGEIQSQYTYRLQEEF